MRAEDVVEVFDFLAGPDITAWVDGGWGVDALLGRQTRPHADLDLAVPLPQEPLLRHVLGRQGFREVSAEPHNPVFQDALGRTIDVHFVDLDQVSIRGDGAAHGGAVAYEVGAFEGEGTIAGRPVPCCTAEYQVRSHAQGYTPDDDDYRDVLALHRRFGIALPPLYASWLPTRAPVAPCE